jgi:hypothetical protein
VLELRQQHRLRLILAPSEGAPTDYGIGGRPEDFATRISPPDPKLLVDFIHREVAAQ